MAGVYTGAVRGLLERCRAAARFLHEHPRLTKTLQVTLLAAVLALCAWAVRSQWADAWPRLQHAKLRYVGLSFAAVAAYYLVFILGWMRLLDAWGIRISYRVALRAEMVSMLAKYLPGGVWTPAARAVALRKSANVTDTPTVIASIFVEAALSAISGVIVFVISLAWVRGVGAPLAPLIAFAVLLASLLHPRIFRPVSRKLMQPFGGHDIEPVPFPVALGLLLFYCGTWVISGFAVWFMLLSLDASPAISTVPFLGGVSAVGAIVAVLAVFAPSGLGAREASMYGLLLAITSSGPALGVTLLNRFAITLVELLLFGAGVAVWRLSRPADVEAGST
jgi:uncharacterized membrane protein YbhN (UPF0104 family)